MVKPFAMLFTVSTIHCISSMVETMRGRPRIGRGDRPGEQPYGRHFFGNRNNRFQEDGKFSRSLALSYLYIAPGAYGTGRGCTFFRAGDHNDVTVRRALSSSLIVAKRTAAEQFLLRCNPLPRLDVSGYAFRMQRIRSGQSAELGAVWQHVFEVSTVQSSTGMKL
ncbi:Uncharacterised protein [Escherichia coli]|uniref:Uncharacterized protein n=1 Tax=Escherichia coli TaxID=562 RepID=A0A377E314_ECOLX|nr:Uncharacterised protein [Escherichia coli]